MEKKQGSVLIALGANLPSGVGRAETTLRAALAEMAQRGLTDMQVSGFYRTPAFPAGAGPDYVNAALACQTELACSDLLGMLHAVEAHFGRERQERWGQRCLDLDLLAVGDRIAPDPATQGKWRDLSPEQQLSQTPEQLILPHPRLQDRAFVLVPLADVAPDWIHPILGLSTAEMLRRLPAEDRGAVVLLDQTDESG